MSIIQIDVAKLKQAISLSKIKPSTISKNSL